MEGAESSLVGVTAEEQNSVITEMDIVDQQAHTKMPNLGIDMITTLPYPAGIMRT